MSEKNLANNELVINSTPVEVVIAFLEDKRLVELNKEKSNNNFSVGDFYLGKVKKLIPGLNAAFVDVGHEKDGFLHYLDLGPQINSLNKFVKSTIAGKQTDALLVNFRNEQDIQKTGKITEVLASNMHVLVQVAKEPISTKGPRITTELTLAGRYLVLIPFSEKISISQKIKSQEERNRLKRLIQSVKPKNFGVIIRTASENKKVAELDADIKDLVEKWESAFNALKKANAPMKILGELSRTSTILRDLLNPSFNNIYVNDSILAEDIKKFIQTIAPEKIDIVKHYKGKEPIFEHFGIEKQIKGLFGKTVTLKSGAYLIIEHTEALHVIDVNSGHRIKSENNQETNALDVNLEAAHEIARQLRLRDLGGIIVIDFIDMHLPANRRDLFDKFREDMKTDRAKHNILPPSKFGLVQITRQRVRPELSVDTVERCPTCNGTGEIRSSILFIDEIENNIRYILNEQNEKDLCLAVHPYIHAFLTKGIISNRVKWFFTFKRWIRLRKVLSYHFIEYHFFNKNEEEIKL